jgi:carboxypeptidase Q
VRQARVASNDRVEMKRMLLRSTGILALSVVLAACGGSRGVPGAAAATPGQLPIRADTGSVAFLIAEGTERSRVAEDLRYLTDIIGPRLTGSPAMRRANEWTAAKLTEYGADSVALEPWPFGVTWERGPIAVRLLAPHTRWIAAASWAWAPGTNGPRAGHVTLVTATTRAEFDRSYRGRLRGAWVMTGPAYPRLNPGGADPADSARVDSLRQASRLRSQQMTGEQRAFLAERENLLAADGVAGVLVDGGKDFGLFTMSGGPDQIVPFPQVVIGNATYAEIQRTLATGAPVRIEANVENRFGRDTVIQWNTVGEIRGTERPDEVVLLGAHLDSWDLGTGATDNAASSIAVLEAARLLGALKARGVRPKRTIRFVLFSGEEQGLYGSQYYAHLHAAELAKFQAVLVLDNGAGRITGMAMQGWNELQDLWRDMFRPLAGLGPLAVRVGNKTGTDHLAFLPAGVPSFNYDQLSRGYDYTHHSQADVLDHTVPRDMQQAAIVMAVNALQLANLDRLLPRKK